MQISPVLRLSAQRREAVLRKMAEALREPVYPYPWELLEEDLKRCGLSGISIVGYGSLVNPVSATKTLRDATVSRSRPVIAFGVRRVFNYEIPPGKGWAIAPAKPHARAALNVRVTGEIDDAVNGILVQISPAEIPAIRAREVGYDLVPVACLDWQGMEQPPFVAYILRCPDDPRNGRRLTNDRIEPHRDYYLLCRHGAAEIGVEFLRAWLATTYLADAVTPVAEWEADEFPEVGGSADARADRE